MAEVGGMIASALGKQIASKLGELVEEEIALLWGFRDDVEGMEEKMKDLEAVMYDADDRMCRGERDGEAVGRWLMKFKSIAYDVEDVLDELDATELIEKTQSKLKLFFSRNNQLLQRMTIAHSMKNVRKKIEKVEKEGRRTLSLVPRAVQPEGSKNNETFVAIGEGMKTGMVGRDTEKEKIINLLLKNDANEDISVIPIVGLGGIGKSTLAESVLADKRVNVFNVQVWVHVSKKFDMHKIGCAIIRSINSSINIDNCTLQFLHDNIKKELATTRYLIVLDDLWEEDGNRLEDLKRVLQYGCKGSRIIVTTRNQRVVQTLSTGFLANERKICPVPQSDHVNLGVLSADDCWEVMKQRAFGPDDDDESILEEVGRQIAAKCGGIPLVANALGQVMFDLRTVKAWEDIRDTKMDLGLGDKILECLMLSYYCMKLEFKMCFTYLAAFPKSFSLSGHHLIQQWIALGYIHKRDEGQRCINYLLGMSFLNIPVSSSVSPSPVHPTSPRELIMHDLVHELATMITANEIIVLDANAPEQRTSYRARYCRHAQMINYHNQSKVLRDLPTKVRSLHFRDSGKVQVPEIAFSRSKYIRVLDLSGRSVGEKSTPSNLDLVGCSVQGQSTSRNISLPYIHQSKLLRYLDATALPITSLPKSFHTLQYMQTLILSKCSLETLSANICSLHKLCYLDLSHNINLNTLPLSVGKLSKLTFLNLSGCSMLQELPESIFELTSLQDLHMSECRSIKKLPDMFGSLPKLIFLDLSSCFKLNKLPTNVRLESLEHFNLSNCHELETLPKDFGNLQKLGFLNLSGCYKLSLLPESFCQLTHLIFLNLSDCHDLSALPDCFGNLSQLDSLNLTSCSKLQVLPESFCKLFKLRLLNISYCVRLEKLPSYLGVLNLELLDISATSFDDLPDSLRDTTTLKQLKVASGNPKLMEQARDIRKHLNLPGLIVHKVKREENKGCSSIVELAPLVCRQLRVLQLQNVRYPEEAERAKLRDKSDLQLLHLCWKLKGEEGKSVLEKLIPPRTLEEFGLVGYISKDFPNWMSDISTYLPSLTNLELCFLGTCGNLPPFGQLPNLRLLAMRNIPNITKIGKEFYGEGGTCRKLRYIQLFSMDNLVEWWTTQSGEEHEESLIPSLHTLQITDCPKLKFLPYPPRCMFWRLENSNMVLPEAGFGKLSSFVLPFQLTVRNCNFDPHKWDRIQHLPTLEILNVFTCTRLRAFPKVLGCLTSLRTLRLWSLKDLEILPEWLGHLTSLEHISIVACPMVTSLPASMKYLITLRELWLTECKGLDVLPEWLGQLISLQQLNITSCPNLTYLPESMKNLTALRELKLKKCSGLDVLPECLGQLTAIQELSIMSCPNLTYLPESMKNLTALRELWMTECKGLDVLPEWLGQLISLQKLNITSCPNRTYLPESMKNLTALQELKLRKCSDLDVLPEWLGQLTSIQKLVIISCPKLTYLPESMKYLTALRELYLTQCNGLDVLPEWLGQLISLQKLSIISCPNLTYLPESMKNLTSLRELRLKKCSGLDVLPEWLGQLISMQELSIISCPNLTYLPESMKYLTALRELWLTECNGLNVLPELLGQLISLQELNIHDCPNLTSLPESMKNLTALRELELSGCKGLDVVPEWLGQLTSLQDLRILQCPNLTSLPESMKNLTALTLLWLVECNGLDVLPEWLGQLISLEEFHIIDCPYLTFLPESIGNLTALKDLYICDCPSLVRRCQGDDAHLISHIEKVVLEPCWSSGDGGILDFLLEAEESNSTDGGSSTLLEAEESNSRDGAMSTSGKSEESNSGDGGLSASGEDEESTYGDAGVMTSGDAGPSTS